MTMINNSAFKQLNFQRSSLNAREQNITFSNGRLLPLYCWVPSCDASWELPCMQMCIRHTIYQFAPFFSCTITGGQLLAYSRFLSACDALATFVRTHIGNTIAFRADLVSVSGLLVTHRDGVVCEHRPQYYVFMGLLSQYRKTRYRF